jgi:beta-glucosidase
MPFPPGFRWGVSTSSYQIEGAASAEGRRPSIWDTFCTEPDRIADGSSGAAACDHYHRYQEDVALMAGLGVDAYRFSVAWPRVQPHGKGPANPPGLAFYDRLVDDLLDHGIDPVATLYHWDLPQRLQDDGGWANRETAHRFADYADLVASVLGDRVKLWITLNEPTIHTFYGHGVGMHAPGERRMAGTLPIAHHQLLAHGLAVAALRARSASPVTIANNYSPVRVLGDSEQDRAAGAAYDALHNRLYTDPLFGLGYPEGIEPPVRDGDLEAIAAPLDGLGVNYYMPIGISAPSDVDSPFRYDMGMVEGYPLTEFGWPVVPEALTELLLDLHQRYAVPLYVTESGCSYEQSPEDAQRVAYLSAHVEAVDTALAKGADVRGYFVWSLMDNFEWAEGFTKRFGLVHVDFATQARTPKSSYFWYRDFIAGTR